MSKLFVDQVDPKTATTLTLGTSGDTISIPSGVTIANAGTATGFASTPVAGTESFYVSKTGSADQTLTNQTYTKMTFDSEGVDAGSNFASDKYTVPSAGKYFFEAQVKGQSSTDSKIQIFVTAIYKNGTMVVRNHNELTAGYEKMISKNVSIVLDLAASDYIEVYCYLGQAGSTTLTVAGDAYGATHFLGYRLT